MSMPTTPAELEALAAEPLKSASDLAGTFVKQDHPGVKPESEVEKILANPGFGNFFTDYMVHATWTAEKGWHNKVVEPYGPLSLDPAGSVLHYGQEVFEGLKAYRHEDGSIWTFRPSYNAARLNFSNHRLAIPEFPMDDFLASIVDLIAADSRWVPSKEGETLYLRPFIFASESFLGVRAATRYEYFLLGSPSGAYFKNGFQPINVWVEQEFHRAGNGGMGAVKTGGNYASSLLPKMEASAKGFDEVLFLDATTSTYLDELGGMNVFVVYKDGKIRTPKLTGNILPGNTRSCIMQLLTRDGVDVAEATIDLKQLLADIESGEVVEMFACGTAAVVTTIGSLTGTDFKVTLPKHDTSKAIYDELTGIQLGTRPDTFGWLYRLA
uniref:branched-chain amino acid aminotransferase n=1 Tax=Actinotignum urinale TaxID=190146 RepID=UPI003899A1F0